MATTENSSVKKIVQRLLNIDEKIFSLHQASTEDFLTLNNYLKNYYKQSELIGYNADEILKIITADKQTEALQELAVLYENLRNYTGLFEHESTTVITALELILASVNQLFIPIRNFRQNIITLRFLDSSLYSFGFDYQATKENRLLENYTDQAKIYLSQTEQDLISFQALIKNSLHKIIELRDTHIGNIETVVLKIFSSKNLVSLKFSEAETKSTILTEKANFFSEGISQIITNLQYHDIIKQKMEHIQSTHFEIINELQQYEHNNSEEFQKKKLLYFSKVKNISNLQIAQLVYTNKEYQDAIAIITNKLLEISENLSSITHLCEQLSRHTKKNDETHFKEIFDNLRLIPPTIRFFLSALNDFEEIYANVNKNFADIQKRLLSFGELCSLAENCMKTVNFDSQQHSTNLLQKNIVNQFNTVHNDLNDSSTNINNIFQKTFQIFQQHFFIPIQNLKNATADLLQNNLNERLEQVITVFRDDDEKVFKLLNENSQLTNNINTKLYASLSKVKYYDFFENVIDSIVVELNGMNQLISNEPIDEEVSMSESFKELEKFYTMKSERKILESLLNNKSDIDFDSQTDDDNFELFL